MKGSALLNWFVEKQALDKDKVGIVGYLLK